MVLAQIALAAAEAGQLASHQFHRHHRRQGGQGCGLDCAFVADGSNVLDGRCFGLSGDAQIQAVC